MHKRTLDEVAAEFRSEGHTPMYRLAETMKSESWSTELVFDSSMLRLWAARKNVPEVEIMITYGDGRHGGRPYNMGLDSFDLEMKQGEAWKTTQGINAQSVLENIRSWLGALK